MMPVSPEALTPDLAPDLAPAPRCSRIAYLNSEVLSDLNQKSNLFGGLQWVMHLSLLIGSGMVWMTLENALWIRIPALFIYGFGLATMFAPVHEFSHRTVFCQPRLNDFCGWWAGVLSFYNSTFYRRYHKWHHRYTQLPGQDPELEDPKPTTLWSYLLQISGWNWWVGKIQGHFRMATGQMDHCPYLSESAKPEVMRSTRLQLALYGSAIALSTALGHPGFLGWAWLLPLAIGQPFLRLILLAEHTDCRLDSDPLANTRTTLTVLPLRLMMWNMPFHAEHHLYPSIPFHQLPKAHTQLKEKLAHVTPGYLKFHQSFIAGLQK